MSKDNKIDTKFNNKLIECIQRVYFENKPSLKDDKKYIALVKDFKLGLVEPFIFLDRADNIYKSFFQIPDEVFFEEGELKPANPRIQVMEALPEEGKGVGNQR